MKSQHALAAGVTGLALLSSVIWITVTQPILPWVPDAVETVVDPNQLKAHVKMLSETFVPRDWRHVENLDRTAAYISQQLAAAGSNVTEEPYRMQANNEKQGKTYRNVVATLGPDTRERIVVGAHYDAYLEYPAADDNASGVAALIELARMLAKESLPLGVDLVAFSLEEPFAEGAKGNFRTPDGGSAVHAASAKASGAQVRLMFSLETIGFFSDSKNSQDFPMLPLRYFYPTEGNYILVVSNLDNALEARRVKSAMRGASPLPVYSISAPSFVEGIDYSDHFNYWKNGYPAVMITDTAFNRNKSYHTAGDTADRLDYGRMAMVVQGVSRAVMAVARYF
jgi:Zn-dependent M28 family amino/carboxypeptidase